MKPIKIRPNTADPEYLDNWVERLDLLCETTGRVGMLGSAFFVGVTSSMFVIPKLADVWGRKPMFIVTMALSLIGQVGLIYSRSLDLSALYILIIGASFTGKAVVGTNYFVEFVPMRA